MEFCSWVPSWPFGAHSISPAALGSNWKNTRRVYVSKIPKSLDVQSSTDAQEPIQTEVGGTGTIYRVVKQDWLKLRKVMLCLFTELFSNLFSHPVYEVIPIKSLSLLVHQMQFLIKPIHSLSKSWKGTSRMKMRDTLSSLKVPKREIDQKYLNKSRKWKLLI